MRKYLIYSLGCIILAVAILVAPMVKRQNHAEITLDTSLYLERTVPLLTINVSELSTLEQLLQQFNNATTISVQFSKSVKVGDDMVELLSVSTQHDYIAETGHTVRISDAGDNDVWYEGDSYYYSADSLDWSYAITGESRALCQEDTYRLVKNCNTIEYILKQLINSDDTKCTELGDYTVYSVGVDTVSVDGALIKSDITADDCLTYLQLRIPNDSDAPYTCNVSTFYQNSDLSIYREVYEYVFEIDKEYNLGIPVAIRSEIL